MIFSIITVTLNNLHNLKKTLSSTLNQSFDDFEIYIIDGNSIDGTKFFLETIEDKKVKYLSEPDSGLYDAMNKGLELAQGDYVIFMNSGDLFAADDILYKLKKEISTTNAEFIYGDAIEESSDGLLRFYKKSRSHKFSWYGMFTHHQAMLYKNATIKSNNLKYNTNYSIAADYQFTLDFLKHSLTKKRVNFPICIFEQGGISTSWKKALLQQISIRKNILGYGVIRLSVINLFLIIAIILRKHLKPIYNLIRFSSPRFS